MTLTELKKFIVDNDKIPYILETLGCRHIKYHENKNYYTATNPDLEADNTSAVVVCANEYLTCFNNTRNIGENADILTLIGFYLEKDFKQSLKYLHSILGTKATYKKNKEKEKSDPLSVFTKIKRYRGKKNVEIEAISEDILSDFSPYIHIDFYKSGVMPWTIKEFKLGYSYKFQRTIIPHYWWLTGELIGIIGRTSIENYKELDIPKYYPIKSYSKSLNLFGLWQNYDSIKKLNYVTVFEGERAVLKRHSLNDTSCVSIGSHSMSEEQARILIGLNVSEIVICMDNDVSIDEIRNMCEKFYGIRKVSYIYDRWGLLPEKSNASDLNNKIYNFMFKYRVTYTRK